MIALIQRVTRAQVDVGSECVGAIGRGLLVLVGVEAGDRQATGERLLERVLAFRVFPDEAGRMNRSVQDIGGGLLIVSQFTLAADTRSGNRPGFSTAAPPAEAAALFEALVARAQGLHEPVATGRFGADMQVSLVNDGPVTFHLRVAPSADSD